MLFSPLLYPASLVYGAIVRFRNLLFDHRIFHSKYSPIPTVVVGNLTAGGTGKTPMIKWMLSGLSDMHPAVLSRGYGRKTKGLREVAIFDLAENTGDEPLEIKRAFPSTTVLVCEDRLKGLDYLKKMYPETGVVLLDDGFQHRRLIPDLALLLFDFESICSSLYLLPYGQLREPLEGIKRANRIVITKCPEQPEHSMIQGALGNTEIPVSYTGIQYKNELEHFLEDNKKLGIPELRQLDVFCITGIAKPGPLHIWLRDKCNGFKALEFNDHQHFSEKDKEDFLFLHASTQKPHLFVCTEKDLVKLRPLLQECDNFPLYVVKTSLQFFPQSDNLALLEYIRNHVRANKRNR